MTYVYTPYGMLSDIYDLYNNHTRYAYDLASRVDTTVLPGFLSETYGYDAESRLTGDSVFNTSGFATTTDSAHDERTLRGAKLSYDRRGNVIATTNPHQRQDAITSSYTGLGQVLQTSTSYRQASWGGGGIVWTSNSRWERTHTDPLGDKLDDTVQTTNSDWFDWYHQRSATSSTSPALDTTKYQAGTGRVKSSWSEVNFSLPDTGNHVLYEYDEKGNLRFSALDANVTKGPSDTTPPDTLKSQASYYGADDRLAASDTRNAIYPPGALNQNLTSLGGSFEEYRYDAIGRRIWVRNRPICFEGVSVACYLATVRRTVWDGDAELYEIQSPGDTNATVAQMETDTTTFKNVTQLQPPNSFWSSSGMFLDRTPWYGRVAYVHGQGTDRPLEVIRLGFGFLVTPGTQSSYVGYSSLVWVPTYDWQGTADNGSLSTGWATTFVNIPVNSMAPVLTPWVAEFSQWSQPFQVTTNWWGTLVAGKRDLSGQLYRRNRYYDPTTGRFTQEDPLGLAGGINAYGFANGDPVNYDDPFGLCPISKDGIPCALVGTAIGGAAGAVTGVVLAGGLTVATEGVGVLAAPEVITAATGLLGSIGGLIGKGLDIYYDAKLSPGEVAGAVHDAGGKVTPHSTKTGEGATIKWPDGSVTDVRVENHPIPGSNGQPVKHGNIQSWDPQGNEVENKHSP